MFQVLVAHPARRYEEGNVACGMTFGVVRDGKEGDDTYAKEGVIVLCYPTSSKVAITLLVI